MSRFQIRDAARCQLIRPRNLMDLINPRGVFSFEHIRDGKIIQTGSSPNVVTVEGKDYMLDLLFQTISTASYSVWWMGLIDAITDWTAVTEDDIYDDLNTAAIGWDEFQDYTTDPASSTTKRGIWDVGEAAAKQVTSDTQTQFDITGGGTIKGAFICGGAVGEADLKNNHVVGSPKNILFCASELSGGDVVVNNSDTFKMTYTVTT